MNNIIRSRYFDNFGGLILIWKYLSFKRKRQIYFTVFSMLLSAILESLTVSVVMPFVTGLTLPTEFKNISFVNYLSDLLNITDQNFLFFLFTIFFVFLVLLTLAIRLLNNYFVNYVSALIGNDLSINGFLKIINNDYENQLEINSSKVITALVQYIDSTVASLMFFLRGLTSLTIAFFLLATTFIVSLKISLLSGLSTILVYIIISKFLNKIFLNNGKIVAINKELRTRSLQESLGSVRDIIIDNNQLYYSSIIKKIDLKIRIKLAQSKFIELVPRYVLESFALLIVIVIVFISAGNDLNQATLIPTLATLGIAYQKILPSVQTVYSAFSRIALYKTEVQKLEKLLSSNSNRSRTNNPKIEDFNFNESIELKNVSFSYRRKSNIKVLDNINLKINKGDKVAIVGTSGQGKTTLLDIILGLLEVTSGNLIIDGKIINNKNYFNNLIVWRGNISHVPQNIYLTDNSILENIVFSTPENKINDYRLSKALQDSDLNEFINKIPKGLNTIVGEKGMQISGGQRQRIAIARALYKDPKVLILDEATSALDTKTKNRILDTLLKDIELTVIMITHDLEIANKCKFVYRLDKGKIYNEK